MAKQPNIRFKGFTEEWKEGKIGDAFCERDEHSGNGELLSVTINSGIRRAKDMERTFAIGDLSKYKVVQKGDIAYNTMRMWQGACGVSEYSGIVSPAYTIATPKDEQDSAFYAYYFKSNKMLHDFRINSQGLTSDTWNLRYPVFASIGIHYPSKKEQQEISLFLRSLDTTITNREAELEKLKNIKRALLEKLFPQDGQSIPAIRFKGFEGKWENRRLKDIATRITRKNIGLESTLPLCISAQLGLVSQTEYYNNVVVGANLANYFLIKKGEFAYNKSAAGEYPMGAVKCLKSPDKGILSTLYIVFALKDDIDADYVQAHYETKPWQDDVKKRVAVGARNHGLLNISPEDFFDSLVVIPHNNDEQKKVGQILAKLSQTISLRERQLTLLKHTKQALLEQMFVNE